MIVHGLLHVAAHFRRIPPQLVLPALARSNSPSTSASSSPIRSLKRPAMSLSKPQSGGRGSSGDAGQEWTKGDWKVPAYVVAEPIPMDDEIWRRNILCQMDRQDREKVFYDREVRGRAWEE